MSVSVCMAWSVVVGAWESTELSGVCYFGTTHQKADVDTVQGGGLRLHNLIDAEVSYLAS